MTLTELREKKDRLENRLAKIREDKSEEVAMGERIMLAGGTSGALGFAEHRYPDRAEILGIPISLASAGVVGTMLVMGTGGRKSRPFLEGVATGAICAYGYRFGAEMGAKSLEDSKKAA